MNNADNHSTPWSDADVRKYLKGELSPREMHELERASLDDPFLADALEGLAASHPDSPVTPQKLETDVDELRSRLAARVETKPRRTPIFWLRKPAFLVAAAIILLAGIGVTVYYTLFSSKALHETPTFARTTTAQPTTPASPTQPAPASTDRTRSTPPKADSFIRPSDNTVAVSSTLKEKKPADQALTRGARDQKAEDQKAEKSLYYKDSQLNAADSQTADTTRDVIALNASPAAPRASNAHPEFRANFSRDKNADIPLLFSGRVVDANNRPLAGASLFLNNAPRIGTTTDASGYFNFKIKPLDTAQQMTVALVGYKQTLISLNSNALTNNVIQLQEAKPSLNEVVITGFGAKRKETYATAPSDDSDVRLDSAWIKVFPVIGKGAYRQYLDTAKRSLRLDSAIYGIERVSFQVDQKGQITEFKIEQSLSPAHDAGTIQLISGGPAWKLLRGRKARAVVSLVFP